MWVLGWYCVIEQFGFGFVECYVDLCVGVVDCVDDDIVIWFLCIEYFVELIGGECVYECFYCGW